MRILNRLMSFVLVVAMVLMMCACDSETGTVLNGADNITVAILCNKETYDVLTGVDSTIELAKKDAYDTYGITLNTVLYDDEGNYNTSIALASQIAADTKITAVVSIQEFDIVDSVANIFNEAKKPFIVFGGCFDSISDSGYDYIIRGFTSAQKLGAIMGEYAVYKGLKKIAVIHTATEFETDEIKGFQSAISQSDTQICDMQVGPFTTEAFEKSYDRWTALGIDGIYMSFYDLTLGGEIIRKIREKGSDIAIMTDYSIDNDETISTNGQYLTGITYIPNWPVVQSTKLDDILERCTKLYGENDYQTYALPMYDLMMMLACYADKEPENGTQLMELLKSKEGYDGVTGRIAFDETGALMISEKQCRIFKDGSFILDETFN